MTKQEILSQALTLEWEDRESLAEELLLSLPPAEREAIDAAWAQEVERRIDRFEKGESVAVPAEEMFRRLEEKYRK